MSAPSHWRKYSRPSLSISCDRWRRLQGSKPQCIAAKPKRQPSDRATSLHACRPRQSTRAPNSRPTLRCSIKISSTSNKYRPPRFLSLASQPPIHNAGTNRAHLKSTKSRGNISISRLSRRRLLRHVVAKIMSKLPR